MCEASTCSGNSVVQCHVRPLERLFFFVFLCGLPLNHLRLVSVTARAPVFPRGGGVTVRAVDAGS